MKHFIVRFIGVLAMIIVIASFGMTAAKDTVLSDRATLALQNLKNMALGNDGVAPSPTDMYAPTLAFEEAIINATERASASVVSITISKDLEVYRNCGNAPFTDVPPELQDLFGFDAPADCVPETVRREVGGGSGLIVSSDGYIVTNKHVVADETAEYTVITNEGEEYTAKVLASDPVQDIAIVKINASGLPVATLGDSNSVRLGQTAIAIGNSLGEFTNSVSVGVISGLSRNITASGENIYGAFQTDAAINPGNSGGPLVNLKGEVIAINTAIAAGAENVGFAIPINDAKKDIESVRSRGEIQAPFLGVRYVPLSTAVAFEEGLSSQEGALLRSSGNEPAIIPGSPAAKAGLRPEDIIVSVDGERITPVMPLNILINRKAVGDRVELVVRRGGDTLTLEATLEERP